MLPTNGLSTSFLLTLNPSALRREERTAGRERGSRACSSLKMRMIPLAAVPSFVGAGFAGLLRARLHTQGPPAVAVCIVSVITSRVLSPFSVPVLLSRHLCACEATV